MRSGGVVVAVLAVALFASCGHSDKNASPTTFTTPHETAAPPPSTTTTTPSTTQPPPPRPWRTGFADGTMPLQDSEADLARDMDGMAATGAHWFRIDFYWATVQDGGPNS